MAHRNVTELQRELIAQQGEIDKFRQEIAHRDRRISDLSTLADRLESSLRGMRIQLDEARNALLAARTANAVATVATVAN